MQPFRPMLAARAKEPFDHEDWIFEVKYDGFRALAYLEEGKCQLVSRRNHVYKSFQKLSSWLGENVQVLDAVIDGELVCLGQDGKPLFNQLLYRRGEPYFYAFDLLRLNGEDLRKEPLIERKRLLKEIMPPAPSRLLFASHQEGSCKDLFRAACAADLEGLVAKWKFGTYAAGDITSWVKIKNPHYSQAKDRHEQFTKFRHLELR